MPRNPQYRLIFGAGGELICAPELERMVAEIAKLAPSDAPQFRRFMADNRVKLERFAPCLSRRSWVGKTCRSCACSPCCPS